MTTRASLALRCAARAISHAASRAAAKHVAAATAWTGVAASAKAAELAGVPAWYLDMIDDGVPLDAGDAGVDACSSSSVVSADELREALDEWLDDERRRAREPETN